MADLKVRLALIQKIAGAILSTKIRSPAIPGAIQRSITRSSAMNVYVI